MDIPSECILVSAMVAPTLGMKLWFTNKHGKLVLNEKTVNCLYICWSIFLIQVCGTLPH